jgi:hypothetical protein
VVALEQDPFTVLAIGLVVGGRPDIVWANAPARFLRRRGWTVTRKRPLSICFPLNELQLSTFTPHGELVNPAIGVESVVISLSSGIEIRQRIYEIVHEAKHNRRFLPHFGRHDDTT